MNSKNAKKWTKEDVNNLHKMYPFIDTDELVIFFGRTKGAIITKAYKLNIKKEISITGIRIVKKDEIDKIIELSKNHSISEIKRIVDRGYTTVKNILDDNNCVPEINKAWWSEKDVEFLKKNFYTLEKDEIEIALNRRWLTICKKARYLGLYRKGADGKDRHFKLITKIEKDFILKNYKYMTISEMSRRLKRSADLIEGFCDKKNIKPFRIRKVPDNYSNEFLLGELKRMNDILGRCPTLLDLSESDNLPSFDIYYDRFESFTNACELAGLKPNGKSFGTTCYSNNNDLCYSVCEQKITNYLISNNIKYRKEVLYSELIPDIKKRFVMDWLLINHGVVVEYFGLQNIPEYAKKTKKKQNLCRNNNVKIISVFDKDLNDLESIFCKIINKSP